MSSPRKTHWALALVKGIREPHEVKNNSFDLGTVGIEHSTLIYTSELILCSTICVHSATRHNIKLDMSITFRINVIFIEPAASVVLNE